MRPGVALDPARPRLTVGLAQVAAVVESAPTAWLALLVVVPAGVFALRRGFDGLYGQDAFAYYDYSAGPLRQALLHLSPLPPFFWPPGYPLLVALASFALGPSPLAGQLVSLAMGALVPVLTALLARELLPGSRALPLLAGILAGLCGQLWQSSYVVMADTTGLALATLGAWAAVRGVRRRDWRWLALAGVALAFALLARWIYGLVALVIATYVLTERPPWRHVLIGGVAAALVLLPVLAPGLLNLALRPAEPAAFAGNFQVYSWAPGNAFLRDFDTPDGHLSYALPNGLYYALVAATPAYFGPLLAPLIALGVWRALRSWSRDALIVIVGWAALVYAFHAGAPWQNVRFPLAAVPPLAVLVATATIWLWQHLPRLAVGAYVAVGLAVVLLGAARLNESFVDRQAQDRRLVEWVAAQVEPAAQLATFGPTLSFSHYSTLRTQDLFELDPDPATVPSGAYVLVDEGNLESQWHDQPPERALRALSARGLERLGQLDAYTLYRVR